MPSPELIGFVPGSGTAVDDGFSMLDCVVPSTLVDEPSVLDRISLVLNTLSMVDMVSAVDEPLMLDCCVTVLDSNSGGADDDGPRSGMVDRVSVWKLLLKGAGSGLFSVSITTTSTK